MSPNFKPRTSPGREYQATSHRSQLWCSFLYSQAECNIKTCSFLIVWVFLTNKLHSRKLQTVYLSYITRTLKTDSRETRVGKRTVVSVRRADEVVQRGRWTHFPRGFFYCRRRDYTKTRPLFAHGYSSNRIIPIASDCGDDGRVKRARGNVSERSIRPRDNTFGAHARQRVRYTAHARRVISDSG